jgi:hypothetical protein
MRGLSAGREQKQDKGREQVIMCGCVQLVSITGGTYPSLFADILPQTRSVT